MIEELLFGESTIIYRKRLPELTLHKKELLKKCEEVIEKQPNVKTDGYAYLRFRDVLEFDGKLEYTNVMDKVVQAGIDNCKELYKKAEYNMIDTDAWVNVVRSQNPVQIQFKHEDLKDINKYHIHTDINEMNNQFRPDYTYVYYIQMPDNLQGEDGVLYFLDENNKEHYILPEEGDLIIMKADLPHAPNNAFNSSVDRMVLAGNVGFQNVKKLKSLI